ncbi:hypothetical protein NP233_g12582 [Leucocoprinus birnbaumii]|uniref:Uncharacterized protein n=1 Tax=Leucocoprinus birnbaumii TaxID=56174 RepID=A0AAD5YPW5_9AGAR|nr:hypothetical protein NP233_g12582 [Leucocoprinus birnbaumii]
MDDYAELEQLARDMASVKVELFEFYDVDQELDTDEALSNLRRSIQNRQGPDSSLERDRRYGDLALPLAGLLASRFVFSRRKESSDLQEAKELEVIVSRHNLNINNQNHNDHYSWELYKYLSARADLIVAFQELEARLPPTLKALLDDKTELEQLEGDLARVKVKLFKCYVGNDDADIDAIIFAQRESLQSYQLGSAFVQKDWRYAIGALKLALPLVSRFTTRGRRSSDLQEAKELDVIISANSRDIISNGSPDDRYNVEMYKFFTVRADLMIIFEMLEARLARLQNQKHPLVSAHQIPIPTLPWTELPSEPIAQVSSQSNATKSLAVFTNTDCNLPPSPCQLDSSVPPFTSQALAVSNSKTATLELAMSALHNANEETEIHDYAISCRGAAQYHFSCYEMTRDALDLAEAAEYSATVYQLFAVALDTDHDPPLLLAQPAQSSSSPSPFASPPYISRSGITMLVQAMSALHKANDKTEIHDYAIYCRALAHCYFSRYRMTTNALDLVEAAEYSATAYHLLADVTDTDHDLLLPLLAQSQSSISGQPLASPPFTSSGFTAAIEWAMSALRRANDKTDIETYASC